MHFFQTQNYIYKLYRREKREKLIKTKSKKMEYEFVSYKDDNKTFHGGLGLDSLSKFLFIGDGSQQGGKKPSSSTLHYQEFAVPSTTFFIPTVNVGGGNRKYDEAVENAVIDDDMYEKLLVPVEVIVTGSKKTRKNVGSGLEADKKKKKTQKKRSVK